MTNHRVEEALGGYDPAVSDHRLPSYRPCGCCGAHCNLGDPDKPCWGSTVIATDPSDPETIHACSGHDGYIAGRPYEPSDRPEDRP